MDRETAAYKADELIKLLITHQNLMGSNHLLGSAAPTLAQNLAQLRLTLIQQLVQQPE